MARIDCIKAIMEASRKAGRDMTQREAEGLLNTIAGRARDRRRFKARANVEENLRHIAGELIASERINAAIDKRNKLLSIRAFRQVFRFATEQNKDNFARGLTRKMEQAFLTGKVHGHDLLNRLHLALESQGEEVLEAFQRGDHGLDVYREAWNISAGLGRATSNDVAHKIARAWTDINSHMVAWKNLNGAYIAEAPGYITLQTHDPDRIRRGGDMGLFRWGAKAKEEAFEAWKSFITGDQVRINWERTNDGQDRENFLKHFFENIYTRNFSETMEDHKVVSFRVHGSMANRLSARRVLWFADADSAFAYNEKFGVAEYNQAMQQQLVNGGREIAILEYFGPNPENTIGRIREALRKEASGLPGTQSLRQLKQLDKSVIDKEWFVLSGNSQVSVNPTLTKIVDNIKAWTLMSKGGGIIISSFPDKAFMASAMAYQGIKSMDRLKFVLSSMTGGHPDRQRILNGIGWLSDSYIMNIQSRWVNDFRPSRAMQKGVDALFRWTGMNAYTRANEHTAAEALAWLLGQDASARWNELPEIRREHYARYDISGDEFEILRGKTQKGYNEESFLVPEAADRLTDEEIIPVLKARNLMATQANMRRFRVDLRAKLSAYFADFIHDASPRPGLRERAMASLNLPRGDFVRELAELFFVFKSFPLTIYNRLIGRFRSAPTVTAWFRANQKPLWHSTVLVAQTMALGHLSNSVKELLKGREPRSLFTPDGNVNWKVLVAAASRGGALGIYGDLLFNEYDRNTRTFSQSLLGPVLGEMDVLARISTLSVKGLAGDEVATQAARYRAVRQMESNIPFLNHFLVKPIIDHMIFFNLNEALSPGVLQRLEHSVARETGQEFIIDPTGAGSIPVTDLSGKIDFFMREIEDYLKSF